MPNPEQEVTQETQEVEKPSVVTPPEATPATVEKPAQPDSVVSPVETESQQKTTEQIEKDRAHWQSEAQRAKAELKAIQVVPVVPEEPVVPVAPVQPQAAPPQTQESDDFLRDHPTQGFVAVGDMLMQGLDSRLTAYEQRAELNAQSRSANNVVKDFCTRNKVSADTLTAAQKHVSELGVKGAPADMANLMIERIQMLEIMGSNQQQVTQAAADAASAAQTQALTTQPETAVPDNQGPNTLEEQLAAKFGPSKSSDFEQEFR